MKYLITMNMASAKGDPVHQIIVEHNTTSVKKFMEQIENTNFILSRHLYRKREVSKKPTWEDRGDLIINTALIGKVQEFFEDGVGDAANH